MKLIWEDFDMVNHERFVFIEGKRKNNFYRQQRNQIVPSENSLSSCSSTEPSYSPESVTCGHVVCFLMGRNIFHFFPSAFTFLWNIENRNSNVLKLLSYGTLFALFSIFLKVFQKIFESKPPSFDIDNSKLSHLTSNF